VRPEFRGLDGSARSQARANNYQIEKRLLGAIHPKGNHLNARNAGSSQSHITFVVFTTINQY